MVKKIKQSGASWTKAVDALNNATQKALKENEDYIDRRKFEGLHYAEFPEEKKKEKQERANKIEQRKKMVKNSHLFQSTGHVRLKSVGVDIKLD